MRKLLSFAVLMLAASVPADGDSRGVLLEFSATWCGPCRQMSPIVSRLERQGYPIRTVDVDRERELARRYGITSIPSFVLVVDGKEVARRVGLQSERSLKELMAQIPRVETAAADRGADPVPSAARGPVARSQADERGPASAAGPPPRFQLPLADSRNEAGRQRAVSASSNDAAPIFRAKYDRDDAPSQPGRRNEPLASSTRIRIRDREGYSFGSGTIIDSRAGRTLVLTCGHIFRTLREDSLIEVHVFQGGGYETYVGRPVEYDLEADVGLIEIPTESPLPFCEVAGPRYAVSRNEPVFSIGCGGGEPPTEEHLRVTALNRYLGPDNIECTGIPEQGRSGGGLFNANGKVIGVCIAADPKEQRGLYAGLKAIQALLDRAGLTHLYRHDVSIARTDEAAQAGHSAPDVLPSSESSEALPLPGENVGPEVAASGRLTPADAATRVGPEEAAQELAVLSGIEEAEVICIIRPLNSPRSASRVVIINRASPRFVSYLKGELQAQPQPTMVKRPAEIGSTEPAEPAPQQAGPTGQEQPRKPARWRPARPRRTSVEPASRIIRRYRRSTASHDRRTFPVD